MPEHRFDHVHFLTKDPEATARFYIQGFGATQVSRREIGEGRYSIGLDLNGTSFLISSLRPDGKVINHIGLGTTDIEASVRKLEEMGIEITQEVRSIPGGHRIAFFKDLDGTLTELVE